MANDIVDQNPKAHVLAGFSRLSDDTPSPLNAAEQYLSCLAESSVVSVRPKLNRIAQFFGYKDYAHCDWHMMRYENVIEFMEYLKTQNIKPGTINGYLWAIRAVSKVAYGLGQISNDTLMRIEFVRPIRYYRKPTGQSLTEDQTNAILEHYEGKTPHEARNFAILLLLLGCGLRRAEVTKIKIENVFLEEGRIRLIGKRNKERDVFLPDAVLKAVTKWVTMRKEFIERWNKIHADQVDKISDSNSGYLFGRWTCCFARLIVDKPITPRQISNIVSHYCGEISALENITPHDLRRTFATRLFEDGVDLNVVRKLMGHQSVNTTILYDMRGDETMRNVMKKVRI